MYILNYTYSIYLFFKTSKYNFNIYRSRHTIFRSTLSLRRVIPEVCNLTSTLYSVGSINQGGHRSIIIPINCFTFYRKQISKLYISTINKAQNSRRSAKSTKTRLTMIGASNLRRKLGEHDDSVVEMRCCTGTTFNYTFTRLLYK